MASRRRRRSRPTFLRRISARHLLPIIGVAVLIGVGVPYWLMPASSSRPMPADRVASRAEADGLARAYCERVLGSGASLTDAVEDELGWRYASFAGAGEVPVGVIRVDRQSGSVSLPGRPELSREDLQLAPTSQGGTREDKSKRR